MIGCGVFGDSGASYKGVLFTIFAARRSIVWNSSLCKRRSSFWSKYPLRIWRTWPIARSQTPPKWDASGGFISHIFP